jgi:hypothetical protein
MKLKTYLVNHSNGLALVSLDDQRPFRAYWPLKMTQVIGGRRWSLSLVRLQGDEPTLIEGETR